MKPLFIGLPKGERGSFLLEKGEFLQKPLISKAKYLLEKTASKAYAKSTVAKNSGQNWSSEISKMHSRIFRGFFYARNKANCATMADCAGEPSGSPCSFESGKTNPARSVTFQLVLEMTVSKFSKETAHV